MKNYDDEKNEKLTKAEIENELFENYTIFEIVEMYNENCIIYSHERVYLAIHEIIEELVMYNENIVDVIEDISEMIHSSNLDNVEYNFYKVEKGAVKGTNDIYKAIDRETLLDYLYLQQ